MKTLLFLLCLIFPLFTCSAQEGPEVRQIPDVPEMLLIAGFADRPPLEFINTQGQPDGILPDIWSLWSEKSGIPIRYQLFSPENARQRVLDGRFHILSAVSPPREDAGNLMYSSPYYQFEIRIFTLNSEHSIRTADDLSPLILGTVQNSPEEKYLKTRMPFLGLRLFPHTAQMVAALAAEEIRAAVGETHEMLFFMGRYAAGGKIRYLAEPLISMDICAAVTPANAKLVPLIDRGFAEMGEENTEFITRRHSGISIGHRIPWHLFSIGVLLLILILAALGFWIWNEQLRRKVDSATEDLREKQQQLLDSQAALRKSQNKYKQLYRETHNERELYRSLLSSSADAIIIKNLAGEITYVNPAFSKLFGRSLEEMREPSPPFIPEEETEEHEQMLQNILEKNISYQGVHAKCITKDNQTVEVSISASRYNDHEEKPAGILIILRDMSETRKLETRLRHAQKMEAIGTLAGGIAHDFNNILSAIMGYTEIARRNVPASGKAADCMDKVLTAGSRAGELIRQILSFSRQEKGPLRPILLVPIIQEVLNLIRASLPATIRTEYDFEADLKYIRGDPVEIHQILMNLCSNARHAMREKGGVLRISVNTVNICPDSSDAYAVPHPGIYQQLRVSDTGHGIEGAILERIFDPYFTTKSKDEGSGIGLSVVHSIIERYKGSITVTSEPEKGTDFRILLPQTDSEPEEENEEKKDFRDTGTEHILFVDDEQFLTDIGKEILSGMGYRVTAVNDSREALEIFSRSPDHFDIIVTDMTMPEITGIQLAKAVFCIRPGIPLILCTGYSESATAPMAEETGIQDFFIKPINYFDLARAVRRLCDKSR